MADPASVNVTLNVTGLSDAEIVAVLRAVPVGMMFNATPSQPAIGGRRYELYVHDLSIVAAGHVLDKLKAHMDAASQPPRPVYVAGINPAPVVDGHPTPDPADTWVCGAFQPARPPDRPYRCTEPYGHAGPHRAAIDGEIVAEWEVSR